MSKKKWKLGQIVLVFSEYLNWKANIFYFVLSGFTTATVVNQPDRKMLNPTSVQCKNSRTHLTQIRINC